MAPGLTSRKVQDWSLTGTIVDSGKSAALVILVVECYVIGSSIQSIHIAGSNITDFLGSFLLAGGEPTRHRETAQQIKKKFCYLGLDNFEEFTKSD